MSNRIPAAVWMAALCALGAELSTTAHAQIYGEANVINTTERSLWLTVYVYDDMSKRALGISRIFGAFCMAPGDKTKVFVDVSKVSRFKVRGEVTRNANCQHPVDCDTTVEVDSGSWSAAKSKYEFRANPQNCWWQDIRDSRNSALMGSDPEELGWVQQPGSASDIAIGADGSRWVIGTDPQAGGFGIYRWIGSSWSKVAGGAVRIAVDPQGKAWVVNNANQIYRYTGSGFAKVPGAARDIGIGGDGSVWVIGTDSVGGSSYAIYKYTGSGWTKIPGGAVRITVDGSGAAWVVNGTNDAFKWMGSSWQQYPGKGKDIGAGGGAVFIVGLDGTPYRFDGQGGWLRTTGILTDIAVNPNGRPCGVNPARQIWCSEPIPPTPWKIHK